MSAGNDPCKAPLSGIDIQKFSHKRLLPYRNFMMKPFSPSVPQGESIPSGSLNAAEFTMTSPGSDGATHHMRDHAGTH